MSLAACRALAALASGSGLVWGSSHRRRWSFVRAEDLRIRVITHNMLSDAHLGNFRRDVATVNAMATAKGLPLPFPPEQPVSFDFGRFAWPLRAARIVPDLGERWLGADIQCLQEVTSLAELPGQGTFAHAASQGSQSEQDLAVVRWRTSRLREVAQVRLQMSQGLKPAVAVVLELLGAPTRLVVVSIHHPGGAGASKQDELTQLLSTLAAALAEKGLDVAASHWIVAGDFNSLALGAPADYLRACGFREAADSSAASSSPGVGPTYFSHAYGLYGEKIDHIFYRPVAGPPLAGSGGGSAVAAGPGAVLRCVSCTVLGTSLDVVDVHLITGRRSQRGTLAISDHLPLEAELTISW